MQPPGRGDRSRPGGQGRAHGQVGVTIQVQDRRAVGDRPAQAPGLPRGVGHPVMVDDVQVHRAPRRAPAQFAVPRLARCQPSHYPRQFGIRGARGWDRGRRRCRQQAKQGEQGTDTAAGPGATGGGGGGGGPAIFA